MNKTFLLIAFFCISTAMFSQVGELNIKENTRNNNNTQGRSNEGGFQGNVRNPAEKPPIDLYKIISTVRDTTFLDTTLTMAKAYKFNYLRRDNFELLPFSNVGQTYNSLAYNFKDVSLKPLFGARARHFNYMEIEDINYYEVPTPLTELYYKTAFEQGQQLDAFFTINTSKQFNFSIAYKGLRSLGKYQHVLTSTGNFRFTTNYHTKDNRYQARAHIVFQDLFNEENGGIRDDFIPIFTSNDPEFQDRGRIEVNFEDAENTLEGKRFYFNHEYAFINKNDSISKNVLKLGNKIFFEDKFYQFKQDSPYDGFGEAYQTSDLRDRTTLEDFYAEAYLNYSNNTIGELTVFGSYVNYNYGYDTVLFLDDETIINRLKGNYFQAGAEYKKMYKGFMLRGKAALNVTGDFDGNYIIADASYRFNEDNAIKATISLNSSAPNYNFLLYQSDYVNYNWQNNFNNVKKQHIQFELQSKKFFDATVSYTGIDDYTYFAGVSDLNTLGEEISTPKPFQYSEKVNYVKIKVSREFRYKKFGLANTILYQEAIEGEEVFKVPQLVTRNSLFYKDEWFNKALSVQTGITFKYFTKYNMNRYDPVLAEFYVQNTQELGGYPLFDLFFNAKVRQTRIYFKFEHINALFSSDRDYFSDPQNPYRDAVVRFGLVWNFFL